MKMIRWGGGTAAALVLSVMATVAQGQSVGQVGGPAEQPPAGFTGQQYVDSRGCVFMRAGFSGQTSWVPRIGRDRKALCGAITPAQAAARLNAPEGLAPNTQIPDSQMPIASAASTAAAGAAQTVGAPMATVASAMGTGQRTGVFAAPQVPGLAAGTAILPNAPLPAATGQRLAQPNGAGTGTGAMGVANTGQRGLAAPALGCPASAPVLQRLPVSTGGSVAVCTRGDGTATGWVSPTYVQGARPGAALSGGLLNPAAYGNGGFVQEGAMAQNATGQHAKGSGGYVQTVIAGQAIVAPSRALGTYKSAWNDDRLNPNRGLGTRAGWAEQAQVWTSTAPAKTFDDIAREKARKASIFAPANTSAPANAARVSGTSMSAPQTGAVQAGQTGVGGRFYVQVGTFGQSANAQNAAGRLAGMGLPVSSAKGTRGGQALVAIMAGPFASASDAQRALAAARQAGFGDAFIR